MLAHAVDHLVYVTVDVDATSDELEACLQFAPRAAAVTSVEVRATH
jgi:hypothetical protein